MKPLPITHHAKVLKTYCRLRDEYDLTFIDMLLDKGYLNTFLFGGFIRDTILKLKPHDVDFRTIISGGNFIDKVNSIESIIKNLNISCQRTNGPSGMVILRFPLPQKKGGAIFFSDVSFVQIKNKSNKLLKQKQIEKAIQTDYTTDAFYLQMSSMKSFSLFTGASDLTHKIIRLSDQKTDLKIKPHLLFRSIYLSTKLPNFTIENNTLKQIAASAPYAKICLTQLSTATDPIIIELLINLIFKGWFINPNQYLNLMEKTGLLNQLISFTVKHFRLKYGAITHPFTYIKSKKNKHNGLNQLWKLLLQAYNLNDHPQIIKQITEFFKLGLLMKQ